MHKTIIRRGTWHLDEQFADLRFQVISSSLPIPRLTKRDESARFYHLTSARLHLPLVHHCLGCLKLPCLNHTMTEAYSTVLIFHHSQKVTFHCPFLTMGENIHIHEQTLSSM